MYIFSHPWGWVSTLLSREPGVIAFLSNHSLMPLFVFVFTAFRRGVPSEDELESLANDISSSWQKLGRRLRISEAKLTAFERQNPELSEQAYKMLLHWKQSRAQAATYSILFKALSDKRVGQSELAVKYCCRKK